MFLIRFHETYLFLLGEKGSGVSKSSNLPTTTQSKIATTKTSSNKIERQPCNASQKLEANRFSQKTSRWVNVYFLYFHIEAISFSIVWYYLVKILLLNFSNSEILFFTAHLYFSTNLQQVNSNVSNNNHNQSLLNKSKNQTHSTNSTDNGIEIKSPLKDVQNNSDNVKGKSTKSPKTAVVGHATVSSVGASSRTASRLQSPFRRRGSPSPVAERINSSHAKRGCSPASNVGRIASSSPASTRKLGNNYTWQKNFTELTNKNHLLPFMPDYFFGNYWTWHICEKDLLIFSIILFFSLLLVTILRR